jgi:[ribosomal protein S5]-alanine N-acetyltransferase
MKISLRKLCVEDAAAFSINANDKEIAQFLTDQFPHPYTTESAVSFIESLAEHNPQRVYAIDLEGVAIGAIGIHPLQDIYSTSAELGYWVARQHWRKGFAVQTLQMIIPIAFLDFPITRLFARTFHTNIGSQKALLKCGFVQEAYLKGTIVKDGNYYDEIVFALRK